MSKILALPLHLAAAKSVAEYLSEAGDDKDRALENARRDVLSREGQNSKARAFQRSYGKLVEKLKLPSEPEDPEAAAESALEALKAFESAGASSAQITAILSKLGLDPTQLEAQVGALKTQAASGGEALKLKRELAFRDAADALGYDAGRLSKVLRDEIGLPEKRTVKVTENGAELEREVWGIPGENSAFTPLTDHGEVRGFEAALRKTPSSDPQTAPTPVQGPTFPAQRQGQNLNPNGVRVDPASITASIAANGAGSI